MRKQLTALALAAAVVSAGASGAVAADRPTVPIKGWSPAAEDTYGPPIGCPDGTDWSWRYSQSGTMWMSHLGRVSFTISHCTSAPGGLFDHGTTVFTAANGDTLEFSHSGTFALSFDSANNPIRSDAVMTWEVTGGTGRFAGATGSGTGTATTTITGPTSGLTGGTWRGTISYGAK